LTSKQSLPADVRLLLDRIESYEQLEMLLLVHCAPQLAADPAELARRLSLTKELVESSLAHLRKNDLLEPKSQSTRRAIDQLDRVYREQRIEIMKQMNANALDRVRNAAIRTFADAFVWRKKSDD
jgi:hypothetical protein